MSRKRKENRSRDGRGREEQENQRAADTAAGGEVAGRKRYLAAGVCALLVLAVAVVFGQTLSHGFINYDDNDYVYDNPHITHDSPAKGIAWAVTSMEAGNWHPLTWASHILDYQLYGRNAGGHHFTSVLLHAVSTVLLFLVLWRMSNALWPSAFVAAVFGVHPLHVESVAWVAERKDVLSGLCFVLILWAYARYVERPASWGRYAAVLALFALGLMAKPMLVTVPFVLLLLDYWPLGRVPQQGGADIPVCPEERNGGRQECLPHRLLWRLIVEKIPLLLLAGAACVVTFVAQGGAVQSLELVPLPWRIANAIVSYATYLRQSVCPMGLAVLYPHPGDNLPIWRVALAALVLVGISAAVLACRRKCPYLLGGWLWYLGMLVPVIGLVQVGGQAMADRYMYLPQIGLCIAVTWGVTELAGSWGVRRWLPIPSVLVVLVLMGCAWRQTGYWRDNESLWNQTLRCTCRNAVAQHNLGQALADGGDIDGAMKHYRAALGIVHNYADAHFGFGVALERSGRIDEAIGEYQLATEIKPEFVQAQNNLGVALAKRGRIDEAVVHYRKALEDESDYAEAHSNLAAALIKLGETAEAMQHFRAAVRLKPEYAQGHYNFGFALAKEGQLDRAIEQFQEALRIDPNYAAARQMLGIMENEREKRSKSAE
jgi:tetratricopeptide (TPR) repeat protein